MELLGDSLSVIRKQYTFTLPKFIDVSLQMLRSLQKLHECGYCHRDIKPGNFVDSQASSLQNPTDLVKCDTVYLIDFGLSFSYLTENGDHIHRSRSHFRGTYRYCSINSHKRVQPSRRDDLESLGYVFIYLLNGSVEWSDCKDPDEVKIQKENLDLSVSGQLTSSVKTFIIYARNLRFDEKPDYGYLEELLSSTFVLSPNVV